jgi:MinD superfamily P-loop ATPase
MKEIVVISGKGGTGKTSICASFAVIAGSNVVVADCDVDAADMHLVLAPDFGQTDQYYSGAFASVDPAKCTGCSVCSSVCRFNAIEIIDAKAIVNPVECEGCGYCSKVCPEQAITDKPALAGEWYTSRIRTGSYMVHAKLEIGADNTGKLVAKVKNEARKLAVMRGRDSLIVDGSPGIGCPVISSLTGATYAVLVTEPSMSALHDLKRVVDLASNFRIPMGCIINKYDINTEISEIIGNYLKETGISLLAMIPYDARFVESVVAGKTVADPDSGYDSSLITNIWNRIEELTNKKAV